MDAPIRVKVISLHSGEQNIRRQEKEQVQQKQVEQRTWTAAEKQSIIMRGIKNSSEVTNICRECGISKDQYNEWSDRFLEGSLKALGKGSPNDTRVIENRKMHLYLDIYELCRERSYKRGVVFNKTYINKNVLAHCIHSASLDMQRTEVFHEIDYPDRHKQAAFSIKWIVKHRPIQLTDEFLIRDNYALMVNEQYALHVGLMSLDLHPDNISQSYISNLLYTLHYRPIIGEVLASKMHLLEKSANKQTP